MKKKKVIRFNTKILMDRPDQQPDFTKDKWRDYMKEKINLHGDDAPVFNESWKILKPPQALLEVKPQSYNPKLVTIGPLYQNLELSPINNFKALCVRKFMERHGISSVGELMQYLSHDQPDELSRIYNLNLSQSDFDWLQLLVTIDTVFIHELDCCFSPRKTLPQVSASTLLFSSLIMTLHSTPEYGGTFCW